LLELAFASPACEPGQDTLVIAFRVLTSCFGSATAFDGAFAQGHGSDLLTLRLLFAHKPAVRLVEIAGALEGLQALSWL